VTQEDNRDRGDALTGVPPTAPEPTDRAGLFLRPFKVMRVGLHDYDPGVNERSVTEENSRST
jgi:hypothetical protein